MKLNHALPEIIDDMKVMLTFKLEPCSDQFISRHNDIDQ